MNLKDIRLKNGFTQAEAAKKLGINVHHLSKCERGERNPSDKLKVKMAQLYGVNPQDILSAVISMCA